MMFQMLYIDPAVMTYAIQAVAGVAIAVGAVAHSDIHIVLLAVNSNLDGCESLGDTLHGHYSAGNAHDCNRTIYNLCTVSERFATYKETREVNFLTLGRSKVYIR